MHRHDRFVRKIVPAGAVSVLATVLLVGYAAEPDRYTRGFEPEQPVHFSHRLHAGDNHIPCQYCHTGPSKSRTAGVPPLETCLNCHRVTRTDRPAIQQITAWAKSGKPFEWRRIYSLPDHVYFDHRPHVNSGIACQECHGEVQRMERISQAMSLRMGACLACHRDPSDALPPGSSIKQGPTHCAVCHR